MSTRFIALSYSPWSEKARWALDHHRVAYVEEEHVPMLGEPLLRLRTRKLRGRVSVPTLLASGVVFGDSLDIARHAEAVGDGAPLFPPAHASDVIAWNSESERALFSGRVLLIRRMMDDRAALEASVPKLFPASMRGLLAPVAKTGAAFLARKYGDDGMTADDHERRLTRALDEWRRQKGDRLCVFGDLSYADIAMAVVLQFVSPVDDAFVPLEPALRAAWTHGPLAERFAELAAWRDALYEAKRRPAG